jgi:uncharacterized protein YbjQ (UPF0145 family)
MRSTLLMLVLVLSAAWVPACAPIEGRTTLMQGVSPVESISAGQVEIVTEQADSDRFQSIARLQYRTPGDNFDGSQERLLIDRLKKEAAAIGADALLDVRISVEENGTETVVNEYRYGDMYPDDRDRRWGSTTTTARIKTGPSYRTVATATAARRR